MIRRTLILAALASLLVVPAFGQETPQEQEQKTQKSFFEDMNYIFSLGIGSGVLTKPEGIETNWDTGFGGLAEFGVTRSLINVFASIDYNFYFVDQERQLQAAEEAGVDLGTRALDMNVFTAFIVVKIKPVETTARPYILGGGGYYRQWIVDAGYAENVLGYEAGAGIEVEIGKRRMLFFEGKLISGRTRGLELANTNSVVGRLGLTWIFK